TPWRSTQDHQRLGQSPRRKRRNLADFPARPVQNCIVYRRPKVHTYTQPECAATDRTFSQWRNGMNLRVWLGCVVLCTPYGWMTAAAQPTNPAPSPASASAPASAGRIGATLQPTVQLVKEALSTLNVDKWKAS